MSTKHVSLHLPLVDHSHSANLTLTAPRARCHLLRPHRKSGRLLLRENIVHQDQVRLERFSTCESCGAEVAADGTKPSRFAHLSLDAVLALHVHTQVEAAHVRLVAKHALVALFWSRSIDSFLQIMSLHHVQVEVVLITKPLRANLTDPIVQALFPPSSGPHVHAMNFEQMERELRFERIAFATDFTDVSRHELPGSLDLVLLGKRFEVVVFLVAMHHHTPLPLERLQTDLALEAAHVVVWKPHVLLVGVAARYMPLQLLLGLVWSVAQLADQRVVLGFLQN